jgi:hypothetical protein
MNWLKYVGDTDILREATQASTVFMFRARREWKLNVLAVASTLLLLFILVLLILGPEGSGISWATREVFGAVFSVVLIAWLLFMGYLFFKYTPGRNDRVVLGLRHYITEQVDPLEEQIRGLSEDALRGKTAEFKQRLTDGESIDAIRRRLMPVSAKPRAGPRRTASSNASLSAAACFENKVAEMRTGEGKTIVCHMGLHEGLPGQARPHRHGQRLPGETRRGVCQPIFELLGVTVGYISVGRWTRAASKASRQAYACDITYGTNSEFGFDYLRDNMKIQHARPGAGQTRLRRRRRGRLDPDRRGPHPADHLRPGPRRRDQLPLADNDRPRAGPQAAGIQPRDGRSASARWGESPPENTAESEIRRTG